MAKKRPPILSTKEYGWVFTFLGQVPRSVKKAFKGCPSIILWDEFGRELWFTPAGLTRPWPKKKRRMLLQAYLVTDEFVVLEQMLFLGTEKWDELWEEFTEKAAEEVSKQVRNFYATGLRFPNMAAMRAVLPGLIAQQIIGVQPMTGPVGQIFTLRMRYGTSVYPTNPLPYVRKPGRKRWHRKII